jgi:hypothetical protein
VTAPLVFTLPLPVNLANTSFGHWAVKHKARKAYWESLDVGVTFKRLPCAPQRPYSRARLDVAMYHTHDTDRDNREARLKWVLDWLTSRGYLVDDADAHLERGEIAVHRCRTIPERRLVLTLTPLAEAA